MGPPGPSALATRDSCTGTRQPSGITRNSWSGQNLSTRSGSTESLNSREITDCERRPGTFCCGGVLRILLWVLVTDLLQLCQLHT